MFKMDSYLQGRFSEAQTDTCKEKKTLEIRCVFVCVNATSYLLKSDGLIFMLNVY